MLVKASLLTLVALSVCNSSFACTDGGAFGVRFGDPVPLWAPEVDEYYFMGGTELKNFLHSVPEPIDGFANYSYSSYRDKRSVYAVLAYKQLIKDQKLLLNDAYRSAVLEKTKTEIAQLAESWRRAYGLEHKPESASGLTWIAETNDVRSRIGTMGGEFLYIDCENKRLQKAAMSNTLPPAPVLPLSPHVEGIRSTWPPRYPLASRRHREEGTVVLKVLIDESGRVERAEIHQSSGFVRLDQAALRGAEAAKFDPILQNGKPTKAWMRAPIKFELEPLPHRDEPHR